MIDLKSHENYRDLLLQKYISLGNLPKPIYLYKYLSLEGGISSLKYTNIQFSHPYTFNDITEGRKSRFIFIGEELRKALLSPSLDFYELNKKIDARNIHLMTDEEIKNKVSDNYEKTTLCNTGIACFTLLENSEFHWENYANNHKGICIRYKFDDLMKFWNANTRLFSFQGIKTLRSNHIIYLNQIKPLIFAEDVKSKLLCEINWMIVKHDDYIPECEFRIYSNDCNIKNDYDRIRISKKSIDKVYIGKNVQNDDKNKIEKLGFLITKTDN